MLPAKMKVASL